MLRRSYCFHLECSRSTTNHADTATKALLSINDCFELLTALRAFHVNCIERAAVYAYLAAIAIFTILNICTSFLTIPF